MKNIRYKNKKFRSVRQLAKHAGLPYSTLLYRMKLAQGDATRAIEGDFGRKGNSRVSLTVGEIYDGYKIVGIAPYKYKNDSHTLYECICTRCSCPRIIYINSSDLKKRIQKNRTVCRHREWNNPKKVDHIRTRYTNIKGRLYNPNHRDYPMFGGNGDILCSDWLKSYAAFEQWCKDNGCTEGKHIHHWNGVYGPDTCVVLRKGDHTALHMMLRWMKSKPGLEEKYIKKINKLLKPYGHSYHSMYGERMREAA